jgi:hypothetical protein
MMARGRACAAVDRQCGNALETRILPGARPRSSPVQWRLW